MNYGITYDTFQKLDHTYTAVMQALHPFLSLSSFWTMSKISIDAFISNYRYIVCHLVHFKYLSGVFPIETQLTSVFSEFMVQPFPSDDDDDEDDLSYMFVDKWCEDSSLGGCIVYWHFIEIFFSEIIRWNYT